MNRGNNKTTTIWTGLHDMVWGLTWTARLRFNSLGYLSTDDRLKGNDRCRWCLNKYSLSTVTIFGGLCWDLQSLFLYFGHLSEHWCWLSALFQHSLRSRNIFDVVPASLPGLKVLIEWRGVSWTRLTWRQRWFFRWSRRAKTFGQTMQCAVFSPSRTSGWSSRMCVTLSAKPSHSAKQM